jgi:hypothetical protein
VKDLLANKMKHAFPLFLKTCHITQGWMHSTRLLKSAEAVAQDRPELEAWVKRMCERCRRSNNSTPFHSCGECPEYTRSRRCELFVCCRWDAHADDWERPWAVPHNAMTDTLNAGSMLQELCVHRSHRPPAAARITHAVHGSPGRIPVSVLMLTRSWAERPSPARRALRARRARRPHAAHALHAAAP